MTNTCKNANVYLILTYSLGLPSMNEKLPASGNFELQIAFLAQEQARISQELYAAGATSRIASALGSTTGAKVDVEGVGQITNMFVPAVRSIRNGSQTVYNELSLVAVEHAASDRVASKSFGYMRLGLLDEYGMVYPYPGLPREDVELVALKAMELVSAKEQGLLADLNNSLLDVFNPRTAIQNFRPQ